MVKRNEILENDMMDNSPESKVGGELPYDVVDDVVVFMQNDPDFYRTETYPTLVNVQKAINNGGKFSKKQMFPMIDKAIESYIKKFDIPKRKDRMINGDAEKMECATRLLNAEKENFRNKEY
jgi:hypothetical protein